MPGMDGTGRAGGGARSGGGPGRGLGRRLGWFSVGNGAPGEGPTRDIRAGLEERRTLLRAELDRTEALLKSAEGGVNGPDEGAGA